MFGLILGGLIFAGAGIAAAIENADMKSSPYTHLDDGTPVYLDIPSEYDHIHGYQSRYNESQRSE